MATPPRRNGTTRRSSRRASLLAQLEVVGRESSAATVMFHGVVAAKLGLTATQEKIVDLLGRLGPLTAGELARHAGLAPASITALVDALEDRGFVRRVPNPGDGRSVLVELDQQRVTAAFTPLFADWVRSLAELYEGYTDDQLATIVHFLGEAARRQREVTARLTDDTGRAS